jgi:hypothetical protein
MSGIRRQDGTDQLRRVRQGPQPEQALEAELRVVGAAASDSSISFAILGSISIG